MGLLIGLARQLGLLEETVHDSVQLLDRLIRRGLAIRTLTSTVLLAAIALIAAQQGAHPPPPPPLTILPNEWFILQSKMMQHYMDSNRRLGSNPLHLATVCLCRMQTSERRILLSLCHHSVCESPPPPPPLE